MVNQRNVHSAVCVATISDGGGICLQEDADSKTGRKAINVLRNKQPQMMIPDLKAKEWMSFEKYTEYKECLEMLLMNCNQDILKIISGKMSGGAGSAIVNALLLKKMVLTTAKLCRSCAGQWRLVWSFFATRLCLEHNYT